MQKTRKTSFLKSLFGAKRPQTEPKKSVLPLDQNQLPQIAGGTGETGLPKGGWG